MTIRDTIATIMETLVLARRDIFLTWSSLNLTMMCQEPLPVFRMQEGHLCKSFPPMLLAVNMSNRDRKLHEYWPQEFLESVL